MTPRALDPLSRLAVRFGSDKFGAHRYTPIYHRLLGHLRELPLRILEIGVGGYDVLAAGGGSLRMWAEYFPFARIVGLDIYRKDIAISPRVTILQGSQTDQGLLQSIVDAHGPFDLVIDDGSHVVHDVLATFRFLYPRLSPEGIYIVEDTLTAFHDRTGGSPSGAGTIFTLAHALSLAMHCPEGHEVRPEGEELAALGAITRAVGFHRNLIVFERGDNGYPVNFGPHFRLDIDDPRVREIYDSIEAEAARNPSSRSSLSRIGMRIWARQTDKAAALALEAAARYPEDEGLLAELVQLMAWAGRHDIAETIEARRGRASGTPP